MNLDIKVCGRISAIVLAGLMVAGCSSTSKETASAKPKKRYMYVPATGSHIGRRVEVDEKGNAKSGMPGDVKSFSGESLENLQRQPVSTGRKGN